MSNTLTTVAQRVLQDLRRLKPGAHISIADVASEHGITARQVRLYMAGALNTGLVTEDAQGYCLPIGPTDPATAAPLSPPAPEPPAPKRKPRAPTAPLPDLATIKPEPFATLPTVCAAGMRIEKYRALLDTLRPNTVLRKLDRRWGGSLRKLISERHNTTRQRFATRSDDGGDTFSLYRPPDAPTPAGGNTRATGRHKKASSK